jgi:hypothetical protein
MFSACRGGIRLRRQADLALILIHSPGPLGRHKISL